MGKQADKIRRSARAEPIVTDTFLVESIQQTERIIDIGQAIAEMIAVVLSFQSLHHLFLRTMVNGCHIPDWLGEISPELILSDAAKGLVAGVHTNVVRLVEAAEHTHL